MDYWFVSLESLAILTSIWNMIGNIGQNTSHITVEFGINMDRNKQYGEAFISWPNIRTSIWLQRENDQPLFLSSYLVRIRLKCL